MRQIRVGTKMLKGMCAVILSLALVVIGLFPVNVVNAKSQIIPNDETGIPDKNLYQAILHALDKKSDGKFTKDEAESLYGLLTADFSGKVKTLKGIENLENLLILEVPDNSLTSLKGIECLTNLQTLRIGKGKLKNINEVKDLSELRTLSVDGNNLEDWTAISNLTNLETLNVSGCGLTGSSMEKAVSKLTRLTSLGISDNSLKDLKSISGLIKLEALYVNNNKLKKLSGIEKLTELKELYVSNNKLTNLKGIENLTKLEILDASKNKITSLPSLKKHKNLNLEYSSFFYNKISEKVFKNNLPSHIPKWWRNNQVLLQNLKKKLKVKNVKKIKSTTKKITGVTEEKATVVLMKSNGKKIKTVKANKKGVFSFKKLDLKKYKGKKLKITAYLLYDDQINGERHKHAIRNVKFTVRKK